MAKLGDIPWNCVCGETVGIVLNARKGAGTYDVTGRPTINITPDTSAVVNHVVSCGEFAELMASGEDQFEILKSGLDLEKDAPAHEADPDFDSDKANDPNDGPTTYDGGQANEVEQKLWGDGVEGPAPEPGYGNTPAYDESGEFPSGAVTVENNTDEPETVLTEEQAKALASDDDASSGD